MSSDPLSGPSPSGPSGDRPPGGQAAQSSQRRRVSRAPVVVVAVGFALAIALVLLGARLAGTPAPSPDLSRPGTADSPRAVNVLMHDYAFNPRVLHLVAAETVRFEIINAGLVDHEFVLGADEVQRAWAEANARATPPAPFATAPPASVEPGSAVAGVRVLLAPGQSATVEYEVPVGASLRLMCHLPGHVERGMVATVRVEPTDARAVGSASASRR